MSERTTLQFVATLGGIQVKPGKDAYGQPKGAELHLAMVIGQPVPPVAPSSWTLNRPRPETPEQAEDEKPAEHKKRVAAAKQGQVDWDKENDRYQDALRKFEADSASMRDRTMAFAQLVGVAAVFGNKPVTVTIQPADQDLLPGFSASLLGPGQ